MLVLLRVTELCARAVGSVSSVRWGRLATARPPRPVRPTTVSIPQSRGGILVDHGWHALRIQQWISGEPDRVSARLKVAVGKPDIEDTAEVVLSIRPAVIPSAAGICSGSFRGGSLIRSGLTREKKRRNHEFGEKRETSAPRGVRAGSFWPGRRTESQSRHLKGAAARSYRRRNSKIGSVGRVAKSCRRPSEGHHPDWFRGVVEEFRKIRDRAGAGEVSPRQNAA
jgi:predicted dehydrogenase